MPKRLINVIVRGDNSGSTSVLTSYFANQSSNYLKKIGPGSSTPKWPISFVKRSSSSDLLSVVVDLSYSISYSSLDTFKSQTFYRVASILNGFGQPIVPTTATIQAAMSGALAKATQFTPKRNYIVITNVNASNAYPIALYTFILLRQFYFIYGDGDCEPVISTVDYWNYVWTANEVSALTLKDGWVPLPPSVKNFSIQALSTIYCKNISVMSTIAARKRQLDYNSGIFIITSRLF